MRSPRRYLLVVVLVLAAGNLWATFHRSGIPVGLTGRVERVEVRHEKHPGLDDVHLVTISGRETHLDADVASWVREGDEVCKRAWSVELTTPRGVRRLGVSRDFGRMAVAMPLMVVLALFLLGRGRGRRETG